MFYKPQNSMANHRLRVMHSIFKSLIQHPILKVLRREVWGYLFFPSHFGSQLDPDLKELREHQTDPIVHENIMFSGLILSE